MWDEITYPFLNFNGCSWSPSQYQDGLSRHGDSIIKTVVRPSYLCNDNSYTNQTSLYWYGPQVIGRRSTIGHKWSHGTFDSYWEHVSIATRTSEWWQLKHRDNRQAFYSVIYKICTFLKRSLLWTVLFSRIHIVYNNACTCLGQSSLPMAPFPSSGLTWKWTKMVTKSIA